MTDTIKGFRDYQGKEAEKQEVIKEIIKSVFQRYGFQPAQTPIIEDRKFVQGDNTNDEAVSDIFKLEDKGKRKLALRYEFTFQLKRLMQNQKTPYKRFQIGPVFRDEPISGNRVRQFTQCDVDVVGSTLKDEAEVLAVANDILNALKIKSIILINNRKLLNEILDDNEIPENKREQVLREIDKYDKLPETELRKNLRSLNAENVLDSLKKGEKYFSQFESYKEVIGLIEYCKLYGVDVKFAPTVIRGLSYYNGTVFEIKTQGIKETITAGGSYIFNKVQCTGISFGIERLSAVTKMIIDLDKILIVSLGEDKKSIQIAQRLRSQGKNVSVFYGKPSKALEYANRYDIKKVIFIGQKEVQKKQLTIKDLVTGKQRTITITRGRFKI